MKEYGKFLEKKSQNALPVGFAFNGDFSPLTMDFQKASVRWAVERGRAAIFGDCGLGKTLIELEWGRQIYQHTKKPVIVYTPLAVADQMVAEGNKFGIHIVHAPHPSKLGKFSATNYEKLHLFDHPEMFGGIILDESSILKSYDGKTRTALIEYAKQIPYRLCATATPAPNDYMELGNHAEFLDILTRSEMLATFFTHDGGETSKWRLKGHAKKPYWSWVAKWALAFRKPSDLGFPDTGFDLPKLNMVPVEVEDNFNSRGRLFTVTAETLQERREVRAQTVGARVAACAELVAKEPNEPWIIWCNLNAEGDALQKAIPGSVQVSGSDPEAVKEKRLNDFTARRIKVLITKPTIAGFGMNWQHCARIAFVGLSDSYEQFYQAVRRCWRFGQKRPVDAYVITSSSEGSVVRNIERKEKQSREMMNGLVENMKDEMQKNLTQAVHQADAYETAVKKSANFTAHLGDSVEVLKSVPDNSIGYTIFSPPFASLYTYTSSNRDMGNCKTEEEFFEHFEFLAPHLLRTLQAGRLLSMHCMNLPTSKSYHGYIGIRDFRGRLIKMFEDVGFIFHSEVVIWKDPLVAMQRTKALGLLHKQIVKDSAMCRQGIPDYLITFRKPGENLKRVAHAPNGFRRFVGDDPPKASVHADAKKNKFSHEVWQRYASPVWMDINPSKTLQFRAAREKDDERHICPLQLEVIERALELWTLPGDLVLSPFMGIGSEGYVALQTKRKFFGVELKKSYWNLAVKNLEHASVTSARKKLF